MSILKTEQRITTTIKHRDLELWLHEEFSVEYDIACNMEASNGSNIRIVIGVESTPDDPMFKHRMKGRTEIHAALYEGEDFPDGCLQALMDYLVRFNYLDRGEFIIGVSW